MTIHAHVGIHGAQYVTAADSPAMTNETACTIRPSMLHVPSGFVKTTLSLVFGSPDRSLSREEVNGWRDAAARRLAALGETTVDGVS